MQTIWLENLADPRLADYRNVRDADLRRSRGVFMAEGRFVVERLVTDSRFTADSLFLTPRAWEAIRPVLARLPEIAPVYVAKQEVFNEIVGFDMHRGCLAAGRIGEELRPEELVGGFPPGPSLLLVLEGLTNTENVGNVFRNALAFGVAGVLLCPRSCDPLYRKAIRVSMGSTLTVPFARFDSWPDSLDGLRSAGYQLIGLDPAEDAVSLSSFSSLSSLSSMSSTPSSIDLGERIALILGTEGKGLSAATREHVDHSLRIPMAAGVDSLNVATASGIVLQFLHARLHHAKRHRPGALPDGQSGATS